LHSEAIVGLCAPSNVNSSLAAFSGQAQSPAAGLSATLLLAVLEGRNALRVVLAGSPLVGTLLFNALLRVG